MLSILLLAGAMGGALFPATARADWAPLNAADPATPTTVTADALPTVQINGVAWAQVVVGNTVYVGGKFTSARPAGVREGTQETPRSHLLAYDIRTGDLITSFAPVLDGQVLALAASPDGSRLYVGGDFYTVDGKARSRVAAFDTATGQLSTTWRPAVTGQVRAIAASASTVYLGGNFSAVGSVGRNRLASVSAATGELLPWAPQPGVGSTDGNRLPNNNPSNKMTSNEVMSIVLAGAGGQVVVSGRFDSLNGVKATGVGALDGTTGATRPFAVNAKLTNQGVNSAIYSLSTDGTNVYGTGYDYYGPGNLEGQFAARVDGGEPVWFNTCLGDSYSSWPSGGALYVAGHSHDCSTMGAFPEQQTRIHQFGTAVSTEPASQIVDGNLPPTLVTNRSPRLQAWLPDFVAGTYTKQYQAGWSVSGNKDYVVYAGEFPTVNGTAQQGLVRFARTSLAPNKVGPTSGTVAFTPTVTAIQGAMRISWRALYDNDNENLTYRVYRDSDTSAPVCEIVRPSTWWNRAMLACTDTGAAAGSHRYLVTATDPAGNRVASSWVTATVGAANKSTERPYASLVSRDGAIGYWSLGETSGTTAADRAGTDDQRLNSGVTVNQAGAIADGDKAYTFRGTSSGTLVAQTKVQGPATFSVEAWFKTSSTTGGKIVGFGSNASGSSSAYDRHVYMDRAGKLVFGVYPNGESTVTTTAALNDGKWHHVVATLGSGGQSMYVDGALVGTRPTFAAQTYQGYWRIGGDSVWGNGANWFNGQIDEVAVYPVALTAAQAAAHNNTGRTGVAPNVAPTASFTASTTDLAVALDAASSADADGRVVGQAWNFGDGTTATGAAVRHVFGTPGTYDVQLTVTDDDGGSATTTRQVTVEAAPVGPGSVAADAFGRQVAQGWGNADLGGAWSALGTTSVAGGAGQFAPVAGQGASVTLNAVRRMDTAVQAAITLPNAPTGGGTYVSVATQRIGGSDYRAKLFYPATGPVQVMLVRMVDGVETVLGGYVLPGTYVPGTSLTVRFETSGAFPTTLKVKAWATGAAEPSEWGLTRTDDTAALQRAGSVLLYAYTSGSATSASVVKVDDLRVEPAGTVVVPNVAPTAAFAATPDGLAVALDSSTSTDPDGTLVGRQWDFGDGTTGTDASPTHAYAVAGTYTVRLTVTDDDGATGTVTKQVTVTAPPPPTGALAADSFGRDVASGWGAAEIGGAWTTTGASSVADGTGRLTPVAGQTSTARLGSVNRSDVSLQATVTMREAATGGGTYVSLATQRVGASDYRAKLRFTSTGGVEVMLVRIVNDTETVLGGYALPGTYRAGTPLVVRFETTGSAPTTLNVKVWAAGTAEPAAWGLTRTDATASLQRPGALFLYAYTSGSATRASSVLVDDLVATSLAGPAPEPEPEPEPQPEPNVAPTASFTANPTGLAVAVDGSGSTDRDGRVASYAWDFGDGGTATGASAQHTYATAGAYPVRLTVTDDDGATATTTREVTVTAPQPGVAPLAADAFERVVAAGWGTADIGGVWTVLGPVANASVLDGAAQLRSLKGQGLGATLGELSRTDVAVQADVTLPRATTGGGTYVSIGTQRVGSTDYRVKLRFTATNSVEIMLVRVVNGVETVLGGTALQGSYVPGTALTVRFETSGTGTTTVQAKVWRTASTEPAAWSISRTDDTVALQRAGAVFVEQYVSGSATEESVVRFDQLWVGPAGTGPSRP